MIDLGSVGDFVGDFVKNTSEAPDFFRDLVQQEEEALINKGTAFKKTLEQAGSQAQQNLKESKYKSTGAKVGGWLSKPVNLILAAASLFGIFYLVKNS